MRLQLVLVGELLLCVFVTISGQKIETNTSLTTSKKLHERINYFSKRLLYYTSTTQPNENFILSPILIWLGLAAVAEGSSYETGQELDNILGISRKPQNVINSIRDYVQMIQKNWLHVNTSFIWINTGNAANVHDDLNFFPFYKDLIEKVYGVKLISRKLSGPSVYLRPDDDEMLLRSSIVLRILGARFPVTKMPFYSNTHEMLGEVNMVYTSDSYHIAYIKDIEARVIELPYDKETHLSLLIILPNNGVSLENMFMNLVEVPLDELLKQLRSTKQLGAIHCFIPRIEIRSRIDLTDVMKNKFKIENLFSKNNARFPYVSRYTDAYVSNVHQAAKVDLSEEGESFDFNRHHNTTYGTGLFKADRPFGFIIIENVNDAILVGGVYGTPPGIKRDVFTSTTAYPDYF